MALTSANVATATPPLEEEAVELLQIVADRLNAEGNGRVDCERMGGGRSGAHVLKLRLPSTTSAVTAAVAKIGQRATIGAERINFENFVSPHLDLHYRPALLAFAEGATMAILSYSYIGAPADRPDTLTRRMQAASSSTTDLVIDHLFGKLRRSWYDDVHICWETDITARYRQHYFSHPPGILGNEQALRRRCAQYFGARVDGDHYVCNGRHFPSPYATLFSAPAPGRYAACIIHGDLNSDNILFDHDGSPKMIDFAKTGKGHVMEDFVALESSLRINHPGNASISGMFEIERQIASGTLIASGEPYAASIFKVRKAAMDQFARLGEGANYQFAVAAIGLRLMQADDLADIAYARICASVMWAMRALTGEPR